MTISRLIEIERRIARLRDQRARVLANHESQRERWGQPKKSEVERVRTLVEELDYEIDELDFERKVYEP